MRRGLTVSRTPPKNGGQDRGFNYHPNDPNATMTEKDKRRIEARIRRAKESVASRVS